MITITEVAAFKCTLVVKEIRLLQLLCLKIHWIVSLAVDVKANFWRRKSQSAEKKLKPLKIEFLGGMKRLQNNNLKFLSYVKKCSKLMHRHANSPPGSQLSRPNPLNYVQKSCRSWISFLSDYPAGHNYTGSWCSYEGTRLPPKCPAVVFGLNTIVGQFAVLYSSPTISFFSVAQTSSQQNNNSTKERPLSLPLLDSFCFQDLCKLVKMPEANSDLICLAWIINSHLSFSIHKGHLNSRKKIVIPRKTSF